jgi:hypothetical protein
VEERQDFTKHPSWDDLLALDPKAVADKSGAEIIDDGGSPAYAVSFLGGRYELRSSDRSVTVPQGRPELGYMPKIILLAYLVLSTNGPSPGISGRETGPQSLPWGDLFFKGPHELPKRPLAEAFGEDLEALSKASEAVGAVPVSPNSWKVKALPNVEIYYYLEPPDDEFPAEARYNFDGNITYYLTLDMIFALSNHLCDMLVSLKGK